MVQPLVYLLAFDGLVCLIWWFFGHVVGVTAPDERLRKAMIYLVIGINVVVVALWFFALLGVDPVGLLTHGPQFQKR